MPKLKCYNGHPLPEIVAYEYPSGDIVCTGCQTWDAFLNEGSPAGTKGIRRADLPHRLDVVKCAFCSTPLPVPCAYCDMVAAEKLRQHVIKCIEARPRRNR